VPVLEVVQEVTDHGHGDEEPHVVEAGESLERDAHHVAVLDHRSAAVAGVDGGVGLHHEVRVDSAVHVAARLHAGHDPRGGRHVLPAEGEAVGEDAASRPGQAAEAQRLHSLAEPPVGHAEHGEVAVVADGLHGGHVGVRLVGAAHQHLAGVRHHVGVGHDSVPLDQEPAAQARLHPLLLPGQAPVEAGAVDLQEDDGFGGVGLGKRDGGS
jgi:hypothetical protein